MKRSAAILGRTPAFLRWAIEMPCPFRSGPSRNLAASTFNEVRSLRAVSVGEIQNRIIDDVCIHPDANHEQPELALGFSVPETQAAYGSKDDFDKACLSCKANIPVSRNELMSAAQLSKAGCFGWLPFYADIQDTESCSQSIGGFMRLLEHYEQIDQLIDPLIVQKFEDSFGASSIPSEMFFESKPAWFGVWNHGVFSGQLITFLNRVTSRIESDSLAWKRLAQAIKTCETECLVLHVEVAPTGYSDGENYTIDSQCVKCGASNPKNPCQACRTTAKPARARRLKVLGLRPYMNLTAIYGIDETSRLVKKKCLG